MTSYNNKTVDLFTITNSNGISVEITNFGARIVSLLVPGIDDKMHDVVMGFDNLEDYFPENNKSDFGAVVGRYANRIAGGKFHIGDKTFSLPLNNGPNCLHGGPIGWQYAVYDVVSHSERQLVMQLLSPDGDNGFPASVRATVSYSLDDNNELRIDYDAVSDAPTVINLTNHSYFNLNGCGECYPGLPACKNNLLSINNHIVAIDADHFLPVDGTMIPTGELASVEGSHFDLRKGLKMIDGLKMSNEFFPGSTESNFWGYDNCFVLNHIGSMDNIAASVYSPYTNILMEVRTTEPGIQLYTGNYLDVSHAKHNANYKRHDALCLETQKFPDSPNNIWPQSNPLLSPDKPFMSSTSFRFRLLEQNDIWKTISTQFAR